MNTVTHRKERQHGSHNSDSSGADESIGIALSGGGVRSASLGLGVLQVAEEENLLERTKYVTAVSGGSYVAAAFFASRSLPCGDDVPWTQGSEEEAHFKRHLRYLIEDWGDLIVVAVRYVLGALGNALPIAAAVAVIATACGLALSWLDLLKGIPEGVTAPHSLTRWLVGSAVVLAAAVFESATEKRRGYRRIRRVLVALAAFAFVPDVVRVVSVSVSQRRIDFGKAGVEIVAATILATVTLTAIVRTQWPEFESRARTVLRVAARLLFGCACAAIIVVPVAYLVAIAVRSASHGWYVLLGSTAVLIVTAFIIPANATSLNGMYEERLMRAYIVKTKHFEQSKSFEESGPSRTDLDNERRLAVEKRDGSCASELQEMSVMGPVDDFADSESWEPDWSVEQTSNRPSTTLPSVRLDDIRLCDLADPSNGKIPELIICAAVNLRDRESAQGEGCASFTFSSSRVGSPALSSGYMSAKEFCRLPYYAKACRLSSIVAASGGAIAPNMGRHTRKGVRLALVLLNLRLGRWLVTPVAQNEAQGEVQIKPVRRTGRQAGALRFASMREAMGWLSVKNRALFVSDGGHWDNSGIVELLRQGCETIFALDAANDRERLGNVLRAISLARSELGVEFASDASLLGEQSPVVRMRYSYPSKGAGSKSGTMYLMRTHMSDEMPSDIVALARSSGAFPRHSTVNQFLSARECGSYIALGRWMMKRAIQVADLPPAAER